MILFSLLVEGRAEKEGKQKQERDEVLKKKEK